MVSGRKEDKGEHRKHENGLIFEDEATKIVVEKQPISKPQLKKELVEKYKRKLGFSERTADKKLIQMGKNETLVRLIHSDFSKYGIKEENKRLVYYVTKEYPKIKEDLDKIFEYIVSGNPVAQKPALEEIRRHDEYFLNPHQLEILASRLDSKDIEFVSDILDTLCEYILERNIRPSDEKKLLVNLKVLLKRCKIDSVKYPNLYQHISWLIAKYKDRIVIDEIKEDAESDDPIMMLSKYQNKHVIPLINLYSVELFDYQINARLQGNEKAYDFISQIKDYAHDPQKNKRLA